MKVEQEGLAVVDVDGSYLYRKYETLTKAGEEVSLPSVLPPPISGWIMQSLAPTIPPVTQGILCIYIYHNCVDCMCLLRVRFGVHIFGRPCWPCG